MKTNIQFTGTNLAAAALLLSYFFFTWVNASIISFTGFDITAKAISPGIYASTFTGLNRLALIALLALPLSAALILFQNITGDKRFEKFFRAAHLAPVAVLLVLLVGSYFKMQSLQSQMNEAMGSFQSFMPKVAVPGLFDILGIGAYASLAASVVLALIGTGRMKDKEYYKMPSNTPASSDTSNNNTSSNNPS